MLDALDALLSALITVILVCGIGFALTFTIAFIVEVIRRIFFKK